MNLKPCPFCGEIPFLERKPLWKTYSGGTVYINDEDAKQNAINAWNRRIDIYDRNHSTRT